MDVDTAACGLRLLAHPGLGAAGISNEEREMLKWSAGELERLAAVGRALYDALGGVLHYGAVAHGDAYAALEQWVGKGSTAEARRG